MPVVLHPTFVVNLTNLVPPPRFDGVAWTGLLIQEAPSEDGPWADIDTQALSPVDPDPTAPQPRQVTTTLATSAGDWFRVIWVDADDHQAIGAPRYTTAPSSTVGAIASVETLKRRLDKTKNADDDELERLLRSASDFIEDLTGRVFRPSPVLDDQGNDTLPPVQKTVYPMRHTGAWFPSVYTLMVPIPATREIDAITLEGAPITAFQPVGDPPWTSLQVFDLIYEYYAPSYLQLSTLGPKMVITGRFGWYPPPEYVVEAVLGIAARGWKEAAAGYGDTVQLQDGSLISYFRQLPPSVQAAVNLLRDCTI